jgi:hypothetical protein
MTHEKDNTEVHRNDETSTPSIRTQSRTKKWLLDKRRLVILAVLLLGLIFVGRGATLWNEAQSGVVIQNWVTPATIIPGHKFILTWGVDGNAQEEPDLWHFHISFTANETAHVMLVWNLNESVLFERRAANVNLTFEVPLPRTQQAWRWDWKIENPESAILAIGNFTILHYPIRFPERQNAIVAIGAGLAMVTTATLTFHYATHRRIRLR